MVKRKIVKLFESRKGGLDYRIKRDYVRNGIATIPCRVSDYSDVISSYSVSDRYVAPNYTDRDVDAVLTEPALLLNLQ